MENQIVSETPKAGKRRAVVYLDRGLYRQIRDEHARRDIAISHVVEEILARHYGAEIPTSS